MESLVPMKTVICDYIVCGIPGMEEKERKLVLSVTQGPASLNLLLGKQKGDGGVSVGSKGFLDLLNRSSCPAGKLSRRKLGDSMKEAGRKDGQQKGFSWIASFYSAFLLSRQLFDSFTKNIRCTFLPYHPFRLPYI